MTPFMFDPWMLWARSWQSDADTQHRRPARTRRSWRIFGKRRAQDQPQDHDPAQDQARERVAPSEPNDDFARWPGLQVQLPLTEDELIRFGRDLESADDVVGRLLAEC